MGLLLSILFGVIPSLIFAYIVYWMDRYEKEPRLLLGGVFVWGAVFAAGAAFLINTFLGMGVYIFTQSEAAAELSTGSVIAPIIEESLKGFAVLMVFLIFRREFDSILDGIVYAAITALGFAATENAFYIYKYGYLENGYTGFAAMVFIRIILVGWQHPFYTSFTGIGLAVARLNRGKAIKLLAVVGGWFAAVTTHALHNTIVSLLPTTGGRVFGTFLDWTGWLFMVIYIMYSLHHERATLIQYMREEVELGNISIQQYQTACSAWAQTAARIGGFVSGSYRLTSRFYQVCGELSHKKRQLAALGDEGGNAQIIEAYRNELRQLSPQVSVA